MNPLITPEFKKIEQFIEKQKEDLKAQLTKAAWCKEHGFEFESKIISDITWPQFRMIQDIETLFINYKKSI